MSGHAGAPPPPGDDRGRASAEYLEGQQDQERQKKPREQTKAHQALGDAKVINIRRLQGRIIVRVQGGEAQLSILRGEYQRQAGIIAATARSK